MVDLIEQFFKLVTVVVTVLKNINIVLYNINNDKSGKTLLTKIPFIERTHT